MRKLMLLTATTLATALVVLTAPQPYAQSFNAAAGTVPAPDPDVPLYFEAASIKPSDPANPPGQGIRLQPGGRFNTFFAALQEQLGLKLDATKGPVEVWVIDSVEHPTPD
jgi:hypothetical protein